MTDPAIVDAAVDYITTTDWVSFVELMRFADDRGIPAKGEYGIEAVPNGVIWAGMSEEFCALIESLREDGRIGLDSGHALSYMADGGALKLPIAKAAPRDPIKGYAKPRWIVSFFRPIAKVRAS